MKRIIIGFLLICGLLGTYTARVYSQEGREIFSQQVMKKEPPKEETKQSEEKVIKEENKRDAGEGGLSGLEKTMTVDYKDADLNSILRSLAWTYKLNIVAGPEVKGKVTMSLKDVTVRTALEAILTINGLVYSERDGVIYVASGDPRTVDMDMEVIFLKYIEAGEAQDLLRKAISSKGDIKINEVANSLVISDFPDNIQKIRELLKKVDVAPQQVIIEAKILDVTSTDLAALGVTWDVDYSPGEGLFERNTPTEEQLGATITMAEESSGLSGGQITLDTLSLKGLTVTATIDALVKEGKADLLASPSIAVLNGQEARIIIGERFPYKERTQTTSGTTETTKFVDIGTTLRVTPRINDDGYITITVHPEVSSLAASLDAGPRITTREADTTVRIKEGETLIIGGLIKQTDDRSYQKVPFFGDLPILGLLFSTRERSVEQKELAVFITPKILRSQEEKRALGKKKTEAREAIVSLEKTAELGLVDRIFKRANDLERGSGTVNSRKPKEFRMAQALSLYQHIVLEFHQSERAPEAAYRTGIIYYQHLKDYKKAKEAFAYVISDYPESRFTKKAKNYYYKADRRLKHKRKKK